jgi:phage terminase large subunit-like protein
MVRQVLAGAGLDGRRVRLVHAVLGKRARAEPVSLLYEQGRVAHGAGLEALEDQMLLLAAEGCERGDSPDRADALVWALTELMLGAAPPRLRTL